MDKNALRNVSVPLRKKPSRIGDQVVSGICKARFWRIDDLRFAVKVPFLPETAELMRYLSGNAEPGALYFTYGGTLIAKQWQLGVREYRKLYQAAGSPQL